MDIHTHMFTHTHDIKIEVRLENKKCTWCDGKENKKLWLRMLWFLKKKLCICKIMGKKKVSVITKSTAENQNQ